MNPKDGGIVHLSKKIFDLLPEIQKVVPQYKDLAPLFASAGNIKIFAQLIGATGKTNALKLLKYLTDNIENISTLTEEQFLRDAPLAEFDQKSNMMVTKIQLEYFRNLKAMKEKEAAEKAAAGSKAEETPPETTIPAARLTHKPPSAD